jgi:hypothetical protein
MFKKEIIWREILYQNLEKKKFKFTQKELAKKFAFSTSTVFNALKIPRQIGACEITGRFFQIRDIEKFLHLWGTFRNFKKDIIYSTHIDASVSEIENSVPAGVIFGAYTAYKKTFGDVPADYDQVYIYTYDVKPIKERFPSKKGYQNLIVLKADPFFKKYGKITPLPQTFVDLYNLPQWYAKDFIRALKEKIDAILA